MPPRNEMKSCGKVSDGTIPCNDSNGYIKSAATSQMT